MRLQLPFKAAVNIENRRTANQVYTAQRLISIIDANSSFNPMCYQLTTVKL